MKNFNEYLSKKGLKKSTIETYQNYLEEKYFPWLKQNQIQAEEVTYNDLLDFVKSLQEKDHRVNYINHILCVIRYYYNSLKQEKKEIKNPAVSMFIRGHIRRIPHDLLSSEKLDKIYTSFDQTGVCGMRNKIMLSLIIYQALTTQELALLEPIHLRLKEGKIDIPKTSKSNRRTLKLEAHQMFDLLEYMNKTREHILSISNKKTSYLFFSSGTGIFLTNTFSKMSNLIKEKHTDYINLRQLRQSRIAIWTKQHEIRRAQYMCGHKYVSSTERYENTHMEDLQEELKKYHPLND